MGRIIILLLMHALGDFFLQSNRLSKIKAFRISSMLEHVGIYTGVFIVLSPIILGLTIVQGLYFSILNGFLHLVVDYFISKGKLKYTDTSESKYILLIFIDHILHISILIVSYVYLFPAAYNTFEPFLKY